MTTASTEVVTRRQALLAAHRELREDIAQLSRDAAFLPARDWLGWCDAVRLRLRRLGAHLKSHFEQEDEAGFLDSLELQAPQHAAACERLQREHRSLIVRLESLAMEAALYTQPPLWNGALRELLADIALHEERENELLLRVLDQAPGAPD
jgi:hypothetical protein